MPKDLSGSDAFQAGSQVATVIAGLDRAARPRRHATRVPMKATIAVFDALGKVGKYKGSTIMVGRPVHEVERLNIEEGDGRRVKKQLRRATREADAWLNERDNKTLGGNKDAVCEFVLVKRSRKASGNKVIGLVRRCFVAPPDELPPEEDRMPQRPSQPSGPSMNPAYPMMDEEEDW